MTRHPTKTYTFGVGKRESHNASLYYARSLFEAELSTDKTVNECPDAALGVRLGDSRDMSFIPSNSVSLMVTSPPYHVGKEYDTDADFATYLKMLEAVFLETYRVLEPGGRAVVNVAGLGRKPYVPLSHLVATMMRDVGFLMRGEIIWKKAAGASGSCAFGSFMSASNPVLRDLHEYLLCFSKGSFGRARKGESTIERQDFLDWTLSVWDVPPESAKRVGHPAPFPVEIPRRAIELYTYKNDIVLDPFAGSGATGVAAVRTGRRFICIDNHAPYVDLAQGRIGAELDLAPTGTEG